MSIVAERQHSSITRYVRMRAGGTPQPVVGRNKKAATFQRLLCDPGEARTLDPMIKSHLLYQLSYGVNILLISVAKVMPFFYPTKFSGYFFQKKLS